MIVNLRESLNKSGVRIGARKCLRIKDKSGRILTYSEHFDRDAVFSADTRIVIYSAVTYS